MASSKKDSLREHIKGSIVRLERGTADGFREVDKVWAGWYKDRLTELENLNDPDAVDRFCAEHFESGDPARDF